MAMGFIEGELRRLGEHDLAEDIALKRRQFARKGHGEDIPLPASDVRRMPGQFGTLLNDHLFKRDLKKGWLANQVGIFREHLSRCMKGRNNPSPALVLKISDFLDLSEEDRKILLAALPQHNDLK
jgi:plasmid maintenance system antidote protein VapI